MKRFNIAKHCLYLLHSGKINPENKYQPHTNKQTKIAANAQAGFTLIEALVVVLMIGVLSAIAAPGWSGFVNRQRLNSVNEGVARAIQKAQREAKAKGMSYNVSFRVKNDVAEFTVYPTVDATKIGSPAIDPKTNTDLIWQKVGEGLELKAKQILFCTNIDENNPNRAGSKNCNLTNPRTIIFDYNGTLSADTDPDLDQNHGLAITVAIPLPNNSTKPSEARRCVKIRTLLASMQAPQNTDCPVP